MIFNCSNPASMAQRILGMGRYHQFEKRLKNILAKKMQKTYLFAGGAAAVLAGIAMLWIGRKR